MRTTLTTLEVAFLIVGILAGLAVLVAAVLAILRLLKTRRAGKQHREPALEITHLDRDLADRVHKVRRSLLPEKEQKKLPKVKYDEDYESTVFLVEFHPEPSSARSRDAPQRNRHHHSSCDRKGRSSGALIRREERSMAMAMRRPSCCECTTPVFPSPSAWTKSPRQAANMRSRGR